MCLAHYELENMIFAMFVTVLPLLPVLQGGWGAHVRAATWHEPC